MAWSTTDKTENLAKLGAARRDYEARPMVCVVRFCGAHPSSIATAVAQAITVLDNYLEHLGESKPRELLVIYRNHIEGAVTVQVGYPVSEQAAASVSGEVFARSTPAGAMVVLSGEKTLDQILSVGRSLPESAAAYTWQSYEEPQFRPWTGRLVETLLVPADLWPHVLSHSGNAAGGA